MVASDPQRYLTIPQDEIDGAAFYRALAEVETDASPSGIDMEGDTPGLGKTIGAGLGEKRHEGP